MNEMILFAAFVVVFVILYHYMRLSTAENCRKLFSIHCAFITLQVFNLCDQMSNSITVTYIKLLCIAVVDFSMVLKTDDF